ncbi:hypothetical protein GCM10012276_14730 [Nocardioides deserti]|nr:hypothetical protein GCM10012276_14730 [Nocardioides deserti]
MQQAATAAVFPAQPGPDGEGGTKESGNTDARPPGGTEGGRPCALLVDRCPAPQGDRGRAALRKVLRPTPVAAAPARYTDLRLVWTRNGRGPARVAPGPAQGGRAEVVRKVS